MTFCESKPDCVQSVGLTLSPRDEFKLDWDGTANGSYARIMESLEGSISEVRQILYCEQTAVYIWSDCDVLYYTFIVYHLIWHVGSLCGALYSIVYSHSSATAGYVSVLRNRCPSHPTLLSFGFLFTLLNFNRYHFSTSFVRFLSILYRYVACPLSI